MTPGINPQTFKIVLSSDAFVKGTLLDSGYSRVEVVKVYKLTLWQKIKIGMGFDIPRFVYEVKTVGENPAACNVNNNNQPKNHNTMKYFYQILRFFIKPNASSFQKESQEIIGVFTKAKDNLTELNAKQAEYMSKLNERVEKIRKEEHAVAKAIRENERVISNLAGFTS